MSTGDSRQYDVSTRAGLMAFYDEAFGIVYQSAARLTDGDREAAEDLVQDAFVKLVQKARSRSISSVGVGWLVTAVRRRHIDRMRATVRESRRLRLVSRAAADTLELDGTATDDILRGLSDRERVALVLHYIEDLPVGDVAELMGTTIRATESLLQRAKRKARGSRRAS